MKSTHLKLFLSLAMIVGIASIDSIAATNRIASIDISAAIPAIGINAIQKPIITNTIDIDPIDIQCSCPIIL
jgi:hypothetical protein